MYKIIRSSRLYEQIVQQVEESIHKGALKAGDQLPPERELAEQFGVSRTAVREAVKTLREKGLVEAYPGRGTFITDGSSNTIRQSLHRMMGSGDSGAGDRGTGDDARRPGRLGGDEGTSGSDGRVKGGSRCIHRGGPGFPSCASGGGWQSDHTFVD